MRNTYSPKRRNKKKSILIPLTAFCVSAVLALSAIAQPGWAWFTASRSAGIGGVETGQYELTITVVNTATDEEVTPGADQVYALSANTEYTVTARRDPESTARCYCYVQSTDGDRYYTDPVKKEIQFFIIPEADTAYAIADAWGEYELNRGQAREEGFTLDDGAQLIAPGQTIGGGTVPETTAPEETIPITESTDPTETTASTEPTSPTETTAPQETTLPTDPPETTLPTDPAETTLPTDPVETTAPTLPPETTEATLSPETEPTEADPPEKPVVVEQSDASAAGNQVLPDDPTDPTTRPTEVTQPPEETEPAPTVPEALPPETTEEDFQEEEDDLPEETDPPAPTEAPKKSKKVKKQDPVPQATRPQTLTPKAGADTEHDIPLIYQTDYPDVRFGAGSLKTSGCGIISLTMVADYLTGHTYDPVSMARWFGGTAENNIARMENAANALKLPWKRSQNFDYSMAALQEGKIVIALMETGSKFTQSQHFIVLTGLNAEGRIMVNDSFEPNYEKWDLKQGFEDGFLRGEILQGYSGGWIFDPSAMPDEPYIYEKAEAPRRENFPDVELSWEDQELIAKVIWVEAQGESAKGQQAVAEIILNRLISDQFGDTVNDVIYSEGQFRSVPRIPEATPWQAQYDALEEALHGEPVLPKDVYYFAREATNENVWGQIGGHIFCYK